MQKAKIKYGLCKAFKEMDIHPCGTGFRKHKGKYQGFGGGHCHKIWWNNNRINKPCYSHRLITNE